MSKPTRPALEGVISKLGTVSAVLDGTVVVQAQPGTPALDEATPQPSHALPWMLELREPVCAARRRA